MSVLRDYRYWRRYHGTSRRHSFWSAFASSDVGCWRRKVLIRLGRCPGCGLKHCMLDVEAGMYGDVP